MVSPSSRVSSLCLFILCLILSKAAVVHFAGGSCGSGLVVARKSSSASFNTKFSLSAFVIVPLKTLSIKSLVPSAPRLSSNRYISV